MCSGDWLASTSGAFPGGAGWAFEQTKIEVLEWN